MRKSVIAIALLALLAPGCTQVLEPCAKDTDCRDGRICGVDGMCTAPGGPDGGLGSARPDLGQSGDAAVDAGASSDGAGDAADVDAGAPDLPEPPDFAGAPPDACSGRGPAYFPCCDGLSEQTNLNGSFCCESVIVSFDGGSGGTWWCTAGLEPSGSNCVANRQCESGHCLVSTIPGQRWQCE